MLKRLIQENIKSALTGVSESENPDIKIGYFAQNIPNINSYGTLIIYRDKIGTKMIPYKEAKISRGKEWFVFYYYINAKGEYERKKVKGGLNRIKDLKEREKTANTLKKVIDDLLAAGFNPFIEEQPFNKPENILGEMSLSKALEFALDKMLPELADSSKKIRKGMLNNILTSVMETGYDLPISKIDLFHIKSILDHLQKKRKLTNSRYNSFWETIHTLLDELKHWGIIKTNPSDNIKKLQVKPTGKYEPLTPEETNKVGKHFKSSFYEMYVFTKIIFRTGIRPDEILCIKEGHINSKGISLEPENPNSKRKLRFVYLDSDLLSDIIKLKSKAEPGQYIFGKEMKPSEKKWRQSAVAEIWRKQIIEGLGINKKMYALKATGADIRLSMGNTLEDVKNSFGHASQETTKIYDKHDRNTQMSQKRLTEIIPEF